MSSASAPFPAPPFTGALLIVISAPSGGGKTTLCQQLIAVRPQIRRVITCTTRAPRVGERDGLDYFFLDLPRFEQRVAAGEFLEHAAVHGHRYGTLQAEVLQHLSAGQDVLLNIDVQGAASIRQRATEDRMLQHALVSIFLAPPSWAELERRLRKRGTDSEETIQHRLAAARQELRHWRAFDFVIVSAGIDEDVRRLEAIIEAEKCRSNRVRSVPLD